MYVVVTVSVFVLCLIVMDAALGALFGELLKAILLAKDKAIMFKETMDHLESTLKSIEPVIRKIEKHNKKLGRPKEELESLKTKMENGAKLVSKCSEIHKLDFVTKIRYQSKLEALEDSLTKFFVIDLAAQTARDQKETLRKVRRMVNAAKKLPFNSVDESNPKPAGEVIESEIEAESDYDDAVSVDSAPICENESDTISHSDEQQVKINEGVDSSVIQGIQIIA